MTQKASDLLNITTASAISDVLDELSIESHCDGIRAIDPSFRAWGRARTVRLAPQSHPGQAHDEYLEDLQAGEMCVMEARGCSTAPVWGDLRSLAARQKGVAGVVIEGASRDISSIPEIGLPVFSRQTTMRGGKGRIRIEAKQTPVAIGGALVEPGDIVFADADGVVVIPQSREDEILNALAQMEAAEAEIKKAILNGSSLADARRTYGYRKRDKTK